MRRICDRQSFNMLNKYANSQFCQAARAQAPNKKAARSAAFSGAVTRG
jgi:hypothetical protein